MSDDFPPPDPGAAVDRRRFLHLLIAAPMAIAVGSRLGWLDVAAAEAPGSTETLLAARAPKRSLAPTPECGDDDDPTPSETEGPFFKPRSPKRTSLLEPGVAGTRLRLTGRVFSRRCRPIAGALIDVWHADDRGDYDNDGFRFRGHQYTDADGRYQLESILPGLYPGRTRHYHVKVQAAGSRVLTTQLYFPGEPENRRDGLFRSDLLVAMDKATGVRAARFHFVLDVA